MKKFLSILLLAMTIPFNSLAQSQETAQDKGLESMVLIPGGTYEMGSRRSLLELNPADLMNTDRHALGPENPAHEDMPSSHHFHFAAGFVSFRTSRLCCRRDQANKTV